jgi:glycogen operon protein
MEPTFRGPGSPGPLGVTPDGEGANVAVFSENATSIELCLFGPDGAREVARLPLPERTGGVWHGHVSPLPEGTLYGFRAHGPWAPDRGERFNPAKLLLDPYARAFSGPFDVTSALLLGHDTERGEGVASLADSAPALPKCVVTALPERVPESDYPRRPWAETVIYEAHVHGLTMQHPDLPQPIRGTYEALGHPAIVEHLASLGVTAIELMPVHAFVDDGRLMALGLRNYWGYNSLGFFAPEMRYFGPNGAAGLRDSIKALHAAGIEVLLDVVYNHTAEGDHRGPTLSFRGLDNRSYYRLQHGRSRRYVNDTGCGNTFRAEHPAGIRLILDSLRFWVERFGVDGFRFDLGTALAREPHGFDAHGGFLDALSQDPVLSRVKLIMEPWDIGPGGYRLGGFPGPIAEWNDQFRDTVRKFWKGEAHAAQELAERLLGSAGLFDGSGRRAWSSINFAACHDGFTLADVCAYNDKHNEANGEDNHDGHGANYSDNGGVEGPTDDEAILAARAQRQRNMLATVFLSQGTPMILAGDEFGNSQGGNNNAYCQDNPISWLDWTLVDHELLGFARKLTALRRANPVLRQPSFLHGEERDADGLPDVAWRAFDGTAVAWRDPGLARFCLVLRGCAESPVYEARDGTILIAFNGRSSAGAVALPSPGPGETWRRVLDTAEPDAPDAPCAADSAVPVAPRSIAVFALGPAS